MSAHRLACLGPRGTYSHLAARRFESVGVDVVMAVSLQEVFATVEKGAADFGILPLENSTAGSIGQVYDRLIPSNLVIYAEFDQGIDHMLMSPSGKLEGVSVLYSHPEPYNQCQKFIHEQLLGCRWVQTMSTTQAMDDCLKDPEGSVAIGSRVAGLERGLKVIREKIQDYADNRTRFVVLGERGKTLPVTQGTPERQRCSIVFTLEDLPGKLVEVLRLFEANGLNMCHIESRPTRGLQWNYYFWASLDVDHVSGLDAALAEVERRVPWCRRLGQYPRLKRINF